MTTLERACRAICRERDPDDVAGGPHPMGQWLDEGEKWWTGYADTVRAVLTEIREPSEAMVKAGNSSKPFNVVGYCEGKVHAVVQRSWPAMIDAMLDEG